MHPAFAFLRHRAASRARQLSALALLSLTAGLLPAATITGRVTDAAAGSSLEGARVTVTGTPEIVFTDRDGAFTLNNVPSGAQHVIISYLGFPEINRAVTVAESTSTRLDVSFGASDTVRLDPVVVEGFRTGQARAQNLRRSSQEIVDAVASDSIGQFPDVNAAEALRRLPGVSMETNRGEGRYIIIRGADKNNVSVTVDGINLPSQEDDRSVALDNYPSAQLEMVQIAKTATADQDGDSTGGAVKLVTKSPFDHESRFVAFDAAGGRNDQSDETSYRANLAFSDRFGAEKNIGLLVAANYDKSPRGLENVNATWSLATIGGQTGYLPSDFRLEDRSFTRKRTGSSARLELRPAAGLRLTLDVLYNTFDLTELRQRTRFEPKGPINATLTGDTFSTFTIVNHSMRKIWDGVETDQTRRQVALGGRREWGRFTLDFRGSFARATEESSADELELRNSSGYNTTFQFNDAWLPTITPAAGSTDQDDASKFKYSANDIRTFDRWDNAWTGTVDAKLALDTASPSFFRAGLKADDRRKHNDVQRIRYDAFLPGPLTMADPRIGGGGPGAGYLDRYDFGPGFNDAATQVFIADKSQFHPIPDKSYSDSVLSDYDVREVISAAYALYQVKLGAWTLQAGLRLEGTDNSARFWEDRNDGKLAADDPTRYRYQRIGHNYVNLLPSFHARYDVSRDVTLRAAATSTIGRPKFSDLAGSRQIDLTKTPVSISQGNPDLKASKSTNLDLMLDYALPNQGLFTAGVFYKRITGAYYSQKTAGTYEGNPAQFSQPFNAGTGHIAGVEFGFEQRFTFLPGMFSGLGVLVNGAITSSSVEVPTRPGETFRFFEQSNQVGNFGLTYQGHGLQLRAAWNRRGSYLDSLQSAGLDNYSAARTTFDVTASFAVTPRWRVFVDGGNLTNAPEKLYAGSERRLINNEYYGSTWLGGFSVNF